jgi:Zn-dependent protease
LSGAETPRSSEADALGSPLFWLRDDPEVFVAFVIAILVGLTFHEFSHAAVATLQGDPTARSQGRLTLNPMVHLDPLGSIAVLIAGFGWARPTPVTPSRLRYRRLGMVVVALAGPAANLVLALASAIALRILYPGGGAVLSDNFSAKLLGGLILWNVLLGVFNLLPIPPLDGSTLLTVLLPPSRQNIVRFLDQYGIFLLLGLLILAPGLLSPIVLAVVRAISRLVGLVILPV